VPTTNRCRRRAATRDRSFAQSLRACRARSDLTAASLDEIRARAAAREMHNFRLRTQADLDGPSDIANQWRFHEHAATSRRLAAQRQASALRRKELGGRCGRLGTDERFHPRTPLASHERNGERATYCSDACRERSVEASPGNQPRAEESSVRPGAGLDSGSSGTNRRHEQM
jgi:hypothetical protein